MLKTSSDQRKPLPNFEHLFATTAQAPSGVARLRELILTLAVQGKLVAQDASDEPASELLKKIWAEKDRLIAEGTIKKDKPLAAITEEEKPFELPEGWEWVRLGVLAKKITDGSHNPPANSYSGYPMLSSQNVKDGGVIDFENPSRYLSEEDFKSEDLRTKIEPNDVLLTIVASLGRAAVVPEKSPKFALQRSVAVINTGISPWFLSMFLGSPIGRAYFDKHAKGTAQKGIYLGKLAELPVSVPPLAEQFRIVTRVEELMRLCDALEEKGRLEHTQHQQLLQAMLDSLTQTTDAHELARHWQRLAQHFDLLIDRPEAVDALEQTILQLAVRGLLTNSFSNEDANDVLLGDVAELINGDRGSNYPNKEEYVEEGIPFINTGHIDPDGKLSNKRMNRITREKFESLRSGKVMKNDLVYCLRGATLGKTAMVEYEEGAIASSLVIIRPREKINSDFLYLFLVSPEGRKNIYLYDNGSAQPNLAANSVRKYKIKLPSLVEQFRIVARVTELRALCQQLREKLTQARTTQTQLAQAWVEQVAA